MHHKDANKCAHIPCQCEVPNGQKYCGEICRFASGEEVESPVNAITSRARWSHDDGGAYDISNQVPRIILRLSSFNLSVIRTRSASEFACILRMTLPRWIFTVTSLVPSSDATCLFSMPDATKYITSRSLAVSDS
jgi:hypothetical protein